MEELLKNYWVVDGDETAWATPQNARNTLEKKKTFFCSHSKAVKFARQTDALLV